MLKNYSSLAENIKEKNSLRIFYIQERLYEVLPIDIIMPTYNRVDSIEASINSVLNQTHPNWNLYIWDDGSTDDTKKYFSRYDSYPKIHYYNSTNKKELHLPGISVRFK